MLFLILIIAIVVLLVINNQKTERIAGMLSAGERSELANLIRLRDAGVLTEEEFEEKKKEYKRWMKQKGLGDERKALIDLHEKGLLDDEELKQKLEIIEKTENRARGIASTDLAEIRRKTSFNDAICFAERTSDSWICICGTENKLSDRNCKKCFSSQKYLLENCTKETLRQ